MALPSDFKKVMDEWVELKRQLASARKDMSVLNKKEKELKAYITNVMSENDVDTITLADQSGKVNKKTRQKRAPFNKNTVRQGLIVYFDNDTARVEGAIECIENTIEPEEVSTVTLTQKKS
jgi:vacuolar-type H+-ATPase subunit D/Vma8